MCSCFAISYNGYPVAPVFHFDCQLSQSISAVPGVSAKLCAITITRFWSTLSLPNNDYRQRLWHYDSRLPCGIVGTHTHTHLSQSQSVSESAQIIIMSVFDFVGNLLILAHCAVNVFGNFTATLPMLSQFLQIKREKSSSFAKTDECQDRQPCVPYTEADDMQRRKAETDRRRRRRCHSARRARLACLLNFLLKSSLACLLWLSTAFLLLTLSLSLSLCVCFSAFLSISLPTFIWLIYGAYCAFNRRPHGVCALF